MKLQEQHVDKIDFPLRDALQQAKGDETLRVIMLLGPVGGYAKTDSESQTLDPAQFASRRDYRQALIIVVDIK